MQTPMQSTFQARSPAQIQESMISPTVLPEHVERGVWGPPAVVQHQANGSAPQRTRFSVSDSSDSDSSDTAKRTTSNSDAEYDMCELNGIDLLSIDGVQRRGARVRRSVPMDGIAAAQRRSKAHFGAGSSDSDIELDDDWHYLCRGRKRRISAGDAAGQQAAALTTGIQHIMHITRYLSSRDCNCGSGYTSEAVDRFLQC
jgi:hypothetical protein